MTDTKFQIIAELAVDHERKRAAFEALGMRNVYGLDAKAREDSAIAYAVAEAEMLQAASRLRGAIKSEAS